MQLSNNLSETWYLSSSKLFALEHAVEVPLLQLLNFVKTNYNMARLVKIVN